MTAETSTSDLTQPTAIFVPRYHEFHEILEEHERAHWNISEIDLRVDVEQWKNGTFTDSDKAYIKNILRLFTQSDTNVCASYYERLIPTFQNADARMMLGSFANREITHMKGYKLLNDTLGYDNEAFMTEFLQYSEMKEKHDFMVETVDLSTVAGKALYLAKQILMEGVNLFGSFAMLLSQSRKGRIPGTVFVNKWSIADESIHVRGLIALFLQYLRENPKIVNNHFKAEIYETARQVVRMEEAFIDLCHRVGTNPCGTPEEFKGFARYVCDFQMQRMGLKPQFGINKNPIPWIDEVTANTFGNFFETTIVEYSKNSMVGEYVY